MLIIIYHYYIRNCQWKKSIFDYYMIVPLGNNPRRRCLRFPERESNNNNIFALKSTESNNYYNLLGDCAPVPPNCLATRVS